VAATAAQLLSQQLLLKASVLEERRVQLVVTVARAALVPVQCTHTLPQHSVLRHHYHGISVASCSQAIASMPATL
jgi:hypothetical protein